MLKKSAGRSAKRKGAKGEREAAKVLNRDFTKLGSFLRARKAPYSGANPFYPGDIEIYAMSGGHTAAWIEVKRPGAAPSIAKMNGLKWRKHRDILMCRQDHGDWWVSLWASAWDRFVTMSGEAEPDIVDWAGISPRGKTLLDIASVSVTHGGAGVFWGDAIYVSPRQFCELMDKACGDHSQEGTRADG